MNVNLNPAAAGAATAISVIDEYFQELHRIERIPHAIHQAQGVAELTFLVDPPHFEMAKPSGADPYTRMLLTGSVEKRFGGTTDVFPLDVKVLLKFVPLSGAIVGMQFDGVDGTPSTPLTVTDVGDLMLGPAFGPLISGFRYPSAKALIDGLKGLESLDPSLVGTIPDADDWSFEVTLMPGGTDTVDTFVASVGFLNAIPSLSESFVPEGQEFAVAFSDSFLDLMLSLGADAYEGETVEGAEILAPLLLFMNPDSIQVKGRAFKAVWFVLPDVTVSFEGPMHPFLVRGTTIMGFDMDEVDVDVGDAAEIFYEVLKWFLTLFAGAALVSGIGWLTIAGIVTFLTAVQKVWNEDVKIENAPNLLRDGLANALGSALSALSTSLDDQTAVGQLTIDATPDSVQVVNGHMVFLAQILVTPRTMQLVAGEYSKELRRFAIFELADGRRFRAQELARLMAAGKVTVPGFHQAGGDYIRANPDDAIANNLLKSFKTNLTSEVVLRNL